MSFTSNRNKVDAKQTKAHKEETDFLLKTIEEKDEQLNRFQTKFRDVTHAYKSILEEKKALEITIKALKTINKPSQKQTDSNNESGSSRMSRSVSISDLSEQGNSTLNDESLKFDQLNSKLDQLDQNEKIDSLTSNLKLLIENKSRLEQNFQAERKKMKADYQELKQKFELNKQETDTNVENYEARLKELRTSLKQSQLEREKLTNDLNSLIKSKSAEQENKILSMHEENQSILLNLRNENNEMKSKLKNLSKQFENKCEQVVQCETEFKNLKKLHEEQTKQDEKIIADLRIQLKEAEKQSESRIIDLESKISELCTAFSHSNDLNTTKSDGLKSLNYFNKRNEEIDKTLDLDSAIEKISELKAFIEKTAKELNIDYDFNKIFFYNRITTEQDIKTKEKDLLESIDKLKEEARLLKDENEKLRIRTSYLIKSARKTFKDTPASNTSEAEEQQLSKKLKEESDVLRRRIVFLEKEKNDEINKQNELHEIQLNELHKKFKQKLDACEHDRLMSISSLEKELVNQRERTLKLLKEKESELKHLKEMSFRFLTNPNGSKMNKSNSENNLNNPETDDKLLESASLNSSMIDNETNNIENSINKTLDLNGNQNDENRILHYKQTKAYKDIEMSKLRLAKSELEYKLKQTLDEHSVDIDRFQNQINVLKQEIERLNLNQSRNELNRENLEYIKNVIFNYMTTKDPNVKTNMQNVLTKILQFTKNEKQRLNSLGGK